MAQNRENFLTFMYKRVSFPKFIFAESVMEEIRRTIGTQPPETGGVLGGPDNHTVTRFFFDHEAACSPVVYNVNAERINPVIQQWNLEDDHLQGFVHAHPPGCLEPSTPDIEFALRLLNRTDNSSMQYFLIPIVQSAANGPFSMRLFAVTRQLDTTVFEVPFEVVSLRELSPFPVQSESYRNFFSRVRHAYDLHRTYKSMLVIIGCGGARAFTEEMVRSGVRFFVLIDPDTVSSSNIATQQCYQRDIGRPKVEVLKEAIKQISPDTVVTALQKRIEDFNDEDMRSLMFDPTKEVETRLLCGFSDNFWAQMRVNLLALQFAVPAMSAQVYRRGAGAEIVFTHPQTTNACARCVLSQRYHAYLNQAFKNDAGSEGSQYYATLRLNAAKFFVAQAISHHGTTHPFWGQMLTRIGQRNCIQIRCDPDISTTLGLQNFEKAFAGANPDRLLCDETVWLPQLPENCQNGYARPCPDCLGLGDLASRMGTFEDTREMVTKAKRGSRTPTP